MEPASAGLAKIFRDLLTRAPVEERPVLAWPMICGPGVAKMTRAVGFTNGLLRVDVADATWRAQLAELAPQYVAGFANLLGDVVTRIEFAVCDTSKEGRGER